MLAAARLDVGLVHQPVDDVDLCAGPAVRTRLGVVLPRTSPLARSNELALADLAGHGLVVFPAPPRPAGTTTCWRCAASTASPPAGSGTPATPSSCAGWCSPVRAWRWSGSPRPAANRGSPGGR
ncbi:LysR substrate-binding domain-containing protein [Catellatospora coxensis]